MAELEVHIIQDQMARRMIEIGEVPVDIKNSAENVAVVVTQSWCGDWKFMQSWLTDGSTIGADSDDMAIRVYTYEYDKTAMRTDFMQFKEGVWKNELIPYVRYYKKGSYIGDSNALGKDSFVSRFSEQ